MGLHRKIMNARIILSKIHKILDTIQSTKVDDDILYETLDEYELVKHSIEIVKNNDYNNDIKYKVRSLDLVRKIKENK